MSRTPIPDHLIHCPEKVERDAERFDHLCRLAEEVAFPIVQEALVRETAATGAEVLTEEAKQALEGLAEEAAILENLDEKQVLRELQLSLSQALPPPDEEECREHARDLSQVLMSTWLESLRSAEPESKIVILSNYLLPPAPSRGMMWLMEYFGTARPKLSQTVIDAAAPFAVNEADVASIMTTLRLKLFPEACLVDLPFNLALIGMPGKPVLMMSRPSYEQLIERIKLHLEELEATKRIAIEQRAFEFSAGKAEPVTARFTTATAQRAVEVLSEPLPAGRYWYLEKVASPSSEADSLATEVRQALTVP
jgi:hypothetical protein